MIINIGTRGSGLAIKQTQLVQEALHKHGIESNITIIKTSGDRITDRPLYEIGGKALFVKELEQALQDNVIDVAVHSMKDVPYDMLDNLHIPAYLKRGNIYDALISNKAHNIAELPLYAKIGTSSVRRSFFLKNLRPDLEILPLRGNIDTRLSKLPEYDAIILAAAGLERLEQWDSQTCHIISPTEMIPAVGQGAIGIQSRKNDESISEVLALINHIETYNLMQIERGFVELIQGSCTTPMGCYVMTDDINLHASFMVSYDNITARSTTIRIPKPDLEQNIGKILYQEGQKAGSILLS